MKLSTLRTLAVVGTASVIGCLSASAADTGLYGKFDAGLNVVQDTKVSLNGVNAGRVTLDPGYRLAVGAGYNFNRFLGAEIETGILGNDLDKLTGTAFRFQDSWYGQVPLLANLICRYENTSRFVPYIGGGAGMVFALADVGRNDAAALGFAGSDSDTDVVFAWQGMTGVNYKLTTSLSLGLAYKYLGTQSPEFGFAGNTVNAGMVHNQSILLVLALGF